MPYFEYQNHQLFYRQAGEGPLMVILPGNTASSDSHEDDITWFSHRFTVAALDYLGTGLSDRIPEFGERWFANCADQTAALIAHLDLGPAVLLGTSGGAVVALQCASRHPTAVRAVIADSFTPIFTQEMLAKNVLADRAVRSEGQVGFWRAAHGEDWENVIDADTAMLTDLVTRGGDWLGESLAVIQCPVMITASLQDQALIRPAQYALEMLEKLQDGRAFISQKGGHPLMWSASEEFRRAISGFLEQFTDLKS